MLFLADAYLHRLDPFAVRFPAGWPIPGVRWYGVSYLAGFAIAWALIRWLARSGRSPIAAAGVTDLMVYVVVGVLVGGRLGYCLFYDPALLVHFSPTFPFWGLLELHKGGMASHGGMIGVIAAGWLYARRNEVPALHLLDVAALACTPGLFLGRLANFVNGELWGEPLPAGRQAAPPAWSVKYPDELVSPGFDAARLDGVRDELIRALQLPAGIHDGDLLDAAWSAVNAGNAQVIELVRPALTAFHPSQLYQALAEGPLLAALLVAVWWRPRRPGVVGSWFLIGYGVLRIATEVFRQPDAGVATITTPLGEVSRGQLFSGLMLLAGAIGLAIASRREVPKLGGLAPRRNVRAA